MQQTKLIKATFTFLLTFIFVIYILPVPIFAFGPSSDEIYQGIDVSTYQGNIDFKKVKESGIEIVYIKSSEGTSLVDPLFEANYKKAKENGLKIGFYHYVTARTEEQAIKQAEFFVSTLSGKVADCKLAMDFESFGDLSKEEINKIGLAFLKKVEELSKKEVVLYSNANNANNIWSGEILNYPLWIAQYEVNEPQNDGNWNSWVGWQYTDVGEIEGIDAYVDRDKYTKEIFLSDTSEVPEPTEKPEPTKKPEPTEEPEPTKKPEPTEKPEPTKKPEQPENPNNPEEPENPSNTKTITIKKGDTLSCLALKYNTTVKELVKLNNIKNPNLIYAGEKLIVPYKKTSNDSTQIYIVQKGDTLSEIAQEFDTTITQIATDNNISNINLIYPGQELKVKNNSLCHDCGHIIYTVQKGDSLWKIARRNNTTIANIVRLNRIKNPNLIYPNQMFRMR